MLSERFAKLVYPEASEEERAFIEKLFHSASEGDLCLEAKKRIPLPSSVAAENPEEELPKSPLCSFGNLYYLQKNWIFETRVLREVKRLSRPISEVPTACLEGLNSEQAEAVEFALKNRLTLITGGPGTGKTFTAGRIVEAFLKENPTARILLGAPTGKAASRLEASLGKRTNVKAGTLHSLLKLGRRHSFVEEEGYLFADLILIDEASMIDARLFAHLLGSVPNHARLVLMGDSAQLPPVEAGSLFADLVDSGKLPTVCLQKCLRSDQEEILFLAEAAKRGDAEEVVKRLASVDPLKEARLYFPGPLVKEPDAATIYKESERFKILCCIRKGPLGADTLNEAILSLFLGEMRSGEWLGVPILITKNDSRTGLYNGDTGVLMLCHRYEEKNYALFSSGKMPACMLPSFEYAYATSVHKSQGSEYERVLLLVSSGAENFGREVLYTAITRAKRALKIAGDPEAVRTALARSSRRRSGLCVRLAVE